MKEVESITNKTEIPSEIPQIMENSNYTPLSINDISELKTKDQKIENKKDLFSLDIKNDRFPYCIVWTPIPLISYILPFIGHTGICTSNGIIHDFAGSYYVGIDNFAFGTPTKYIMLYPNEKERNEWDNSIEKGDLKYNMEFHNLCCNNCHSHCAYVLNVLNYNNRNNYTMVSIWWMLVTKSKYISFFSFVRTYLGFFILASLTYLVMKYLD